MFLPPQLDASIQALLEKVSWKEIKKSALSLSSLYRDGEGIFSDEHILAYLTVRLPATFAVNSRVLQELKGFSFQSLLDIGAGPGTAAWAATQHFETIEKVTLVEREKGFMQVGKALAKEHQILNRASWILQSVQECPFSPHDLVIASYTYGEFRNDHVLKKAWDNTKNAFVLIEPGTPKGFADLLHARDQLLTWGAHLVAPCALNAACPLAGSDKWCHFAVRVGRSHLHQYAKEASLPYEDEKFCYLIAAKTPHHALQARLLHDPQKHSGHVALTLCTNKGLQQTIVSRRHKELYKQARKAEWGDRIDLQEII